MSLLAELPKKHRFGRELSAALRSSGISESQARSIAFGLVDINDYKMLRAKFRAATKN
jgi:hypothetical protein